jgi:penicillin-binding protein 2
MDIPLTRFGYKKKTLRQIETIQPFMRLHESNVISRVRIWPFITLIVVCMLVLYFRLGQLTIVEGVYRRKLADDNRVVAVRRAAARGIFFDRDGTALVNNVPIYKRQVPGTTVAQAQFESISHEEAVRLSHAAGERVFFDIKREYTCGKPCSVLMGFIGEVNRDDLNNLNGYVMGDLIGKSGLEKVYERQLRGVPGSELIEVDALGNLVREIGRNYPVAGNEMKLTIDLELQQLLYEAFDGQSGAAVAQNPHTGEILAMVSSPAYDPNDVVSYLNAKEKPFFNRAISGIYPPGSIYKIVTAVAGLEENVIDAQKTYEDTGELVVSGYRFGTWFYLEYGRTEGAVNVVKGLQRSNDIYFYRLGGDLGATKLAEWSRLFGLESTGGLESWGAIKGVIPDPVWKERVKGERWYLGNTYHMSIGQGDVLTSPMQVNRMVGAMATGGVLCDPVILESEIGKRSCVQLNLRRETVEIVHEGLKKACEPGGTGVPFFRFEPRVACKTGTAEQGIKGSTPHAWFSVYAPADNPEIVLTVLVEASGQGSEVAAPIARDALEYWFYTKEGKLFKEAPRIVLDESIIEAGD